MAKKGRVEKLPSRPEGFRSEVGAKYGGTGKHPPSRTLSRETQFRRELKKVEKEARDIKPGV